MEKFLIKEFLLILGVCLLITDVIFELNDGLMIVLSFLPLVFGGLYVIVTKQEKEKLQEIHKMTLWISSIVTISCLLISVFC